jgi:hypothetical protein
LFLVSLVTDAFFLLALANGSRSNCACAPSAVTSTVGIAAHSKSIRN